MNPIRDAKTPEACAEALETMLAAEADTHSRLALLFDAAMTYERLNDVTHLEDVTRQIGASEGDILPDDERQPSLKEAAFTHLAVMLLRNGRKPEAAAALAHSARAALQAGRALRAIWFVAQVLHDMLPKQGPGVIACLVSVVQEAVDSVPAGRELCEALAEVGYEAYQHGDAAAALALQERALGLSAYADQENLAGLLSNQVVIGLETGDLRRVSRYGRRAAAATRGVGMGDPVSLLAYTVGAEVELGRSEEALALLDEVESEVPPSDLTRYTRARLLIDLKRHNEAAGILKGLVFDGADDLRRRLARETSGPLELDCAHRVLGMALGMRESEVGHAHEMPQLVGDSTAYRIPDLTDADRRKFDRLLAQIEHPLMQTHWDEPNGSIPPTFLMPTIFEYTNDVADFEQKWHLYARERAVQARRRALQRDWDNYRQRYAGPRDVARSDVIEIVGACATLAGLSRELASTGERDTFAIVAMYAADLLEARHTDPFTAAFAWAQRAQVIGAARLLAGEEVTLLGVELQRCHQQFTVLASGLDPERAAGLLDQTLEGWLDLSEDEGGGISVGALADLAVPLLPLLDPGTQLQAGVALSFAGRHWEAVEVISAALHGARAKAPDTLIVYPERVGIAFATAQVASRCPDADKCRAAYGPFAGAIYDEVRAWAPDVLPYPFEPDEPLPTAQVQPLAFAVPPFVVLQQGLYGDAYAAAAMHEMDHLMLRMGQMERTPDGRWRRVKRDVPVSSALTYEYLLRAESRVDADSGDNERSLPGMDAIRSLASMGKTAASRDSGNVGRQIQNMLDYFDALGRQETPASYPCAALLAGTARALLGDGAHSYLFHLKVTDHTEALQFGAQHAAELAEAPTAEPAVQPAPRHDDELTDEDLEPPPPDSAASRSLAEAPPSASEGSPLVQLRHDNEVGAVAFSPDGTLLATASDDKTARLWEVATGTEVAQLRHDGKVYRVAFSPDGTRLATVSDDKTASYDKTARLWEVASGREVAQLRHAGWVYAMAFSPDGTWLATASQDGVARLLGVATGREATLLQHEGAVCAVAFSPDSTLVATASHDGTARLWEVATGRERARMGPGDPMASALLVAFSPDGTLLATDAGDPPEPWDRGTPVRLWEVATGREGVQMRHGGTPIAAAFSPDGTLLATNDIVEATAQLWEVATGRKHAEMKHTGTLFKDRLRQVAFSPDGTLLATAGEDGTARLWVVATGREIARLRHDGAVSAVAFSPDGTLLATASDDGTARLWAA
jgi:WD40 repeat protein